MCYKVGIERSRGCKMGKGGGVHVLLLCGEEIRRNDNNSRQIISDYALIELVGKEVCDVLDLV